MFNVIEYRRAKVKQFMASARAAVSPKHRKMLVQRARAVHHKMLRAKPLRLAESMVDCSAKTGLWFNPRS